VTLNREPEQRRRRGQALEDAILDAAWEELVEGGYGGFTFEGVARRAGTSRPVLYRRWPTRQELVRAAIAHRGEREEVVLPDTGSLRGDLIALLGEVNERRGSLMALMVLRMSEYYEETGTSMSDLRLAFIGNRGSRVTEVMRRAVERGEIDPDRLTPRIAAVPFDLFRHELLMTLKPVTEETIIEIVDTIFLPLVEPR
jgi:AcrR family transcriptional regulator